MKACDIYERQMYVDICKGLKRLADGAQWSPKDIRHIVQERHCGNGYWSMDGLLDDLERLVGLDKAADILNACR